MPLSESELGGLLASVGNHRGKRPLSPTEVAELLSRLIAEGRSRKDLADAVGLSVTQIGDFTRLLKLDPEVRDLAGWGRDDSGASIPFSSLAQLASMSSQDQLFSASAILTHSIRWSEVVEIAQLVRRSGGSAEVCVEQVLARRPEIVQRYLMIGHLDTVSADLLLASSQGDRDRLFSEFVEQLEPVGGLELRLGVRSFSALADSPIEGIIGISPDEFEERLNSFIRGVCQ